MTATATTTKKKGSGIIPAQRVKALEMAQQFAQRGTDMYRAAYDEGMTLSAFLNRSVERERGLDGFQTMIFAMGINPESDHREGERASTVEEFWRAADGAGKALFPEYMSRMWRRATHPVAPEVRQLYTSNDRPIGTLENAYADNMTPRWDTTLTAAISVADLVALTTGITGNAYRSMFLLNDASQQHMARVGEGATIPEFKLVTSNVTINLLKYGGALRTTYEQLRQMPIDTLSYHLARMAIQAEVDKVAKVIEVLISGDGNANTAAEVINLSALDAAASGSLTLKAWINFKMRFKNPYVLTTALGRDAVISQLWLLLAGVGNNTVLALNPGNGAFGNITPINQALTGTVAIGNTDEVGANKLLGFDRRLAIERVYETGANIQEVERFIHNQTELMTMTETEGYAVWDRDAAKIIDLAA